MTYLYALGAVSAFTAAFFAWSLLHPQSFVSFAKAIVAVFTGALLLTPFVALGHWLVTR